jgi:hypothetical protein
VLLGGFLALMLVMGVLGRRHAPEATVGDYRPSTLVTGPSGTSALAETLEALGLPVDPRRISLFGVADDLGPQASTVGVMVVEPSVTGMTDEEAAEAVRYLRTGGTLVLAGFTGIERGLGYAAVLVGDDEDSARVVVPAGIDSLPPVHVVVGTRRRPSPGDARPPEVERVDTLFATIGGRPVALLARFDGGGRALLIGEDALLRNWSLRETDAGAMVIPWILSLGLTRLVVDEYHHGFGQGALARSSWRWLIGGPAGWALLQLCVAGLITLIYLAVRFGPAIHVIRRRRRSPLEHLEALASGLERVHAAGTATDLLGRGLARRLRKRGHDVPRAAWARDRDRWLTTLGRGSDNPAIQAAVQRLGSLLGGAGPSGDLRVLGTAQAVEDVWEALKRPSGPGRSSAR